MSLFKKSRSSPEAALTPLLLAAEKELLFLFLITLTGNDHCRPKTSSVSSVEALSTTMTSNDL